MNSPDEEADGSRRGLPTTLRTPVTDLPAERLAQPDLMDLDLIDLDLMDLDLMDLDPADPCRV
jgi:hypothetical protein